jgi:glycosyltransferase involved in cell wall biosynthesis
LRPSCERSLEARDVIVRTSPVTAVEITVVSDGSTDRTAELAASYGDLIRLVVFPENRGYGAAIKAAWQESDADLLGFLDADGTCDPQAFAPLCTALLAANADVAVGCRLNAESRMPFVRRVGNVLFAVLLSAVSSERVRDVSSGMRVVRRSSLPRLLPLPDGLHHAGDERTDAPQHRSRVRRGADSLSRARRTLEAARHAGRAPLLIAMPTLYYLRHRSVAEWMIYRFVP